MRTAPGPNLPPIPGVNQGTAVAAGDGDAESNSGKEGEGGDNENANGADGEGDASGGENGADGCGDPVCPITGEDVPRRPGLRLWRPDGAAPGSGTTTPAAPIGTAMSGTAGRTPSAGRSASEEHGQIVPDDKARVQQLDAPPLSGLPVRNRFSLGLSREPEGLTLRMPEGERYIFGPDIGAGIHCLVAVAGSQRQPDYAPARRPRPARRHGRLGGTTVSHRQRQGRPDHLRPHRLRSRPLAMDDGGRLRLRRRWQPRVLHGRRAARVAVPQSAT